MMAKFSTILAAIFLFSSVLPMQYAVAQDSTYEIVPDKFPSNNIEMFKFSAGSPLEDFMIVRHKSSVECGTHGCSTDFYKKSKNKTYKKFGDPMITIGSIYKKMCGSNFSLIFTPGAGVNSKYAEWRFNQSDIEMIKKYESLGEASVCP